jgi:phage terminase small subunit
MREPEKPLTAKQEQFCQEYLIDLNATKSAIRAGYSQGTAGSIGCENLMKPEIQSRISVLQEERSKRCQVTQDEVIHELKRLGFSDMRKFAKWNGNDVTLKDSDELTDDDAACVESLGQTTSLNGGSLSFKLHSKPKALELLARHLGMLNDKMNLGGQKDNPLACQPIFNCSPVSATMVQDLLSGKKPNAAPEDKQPDASI